MGRSNFHKICGGGLADRQATNLGGRVAPGPRRSERNVADLIAVRTLARTTQTNKKQIT